MRDLLFISGQYIRHHKIKLSVMIFAVTLIIWLPLAVQSIVEQTTNQLLKRAETTPLVIGAKGSPLELSLGSLYFQTQPSSTLSYDDLAEVELSGLAKAIPLHYRFHSQGHPIVGTTLDYLAHRGLKLSQGRQMALLGEAVVGSSVAEILRLSVGDSIISSPETLFDIAGIYPLKMTVTGILERSFSPDDEAIFVDIKTSWVIQGLGHGHQDLANKKSIKQILKKSGSNIIANASVVHYNEITDDNIDDFHFHGENSQRPISAILPVPRNAKSATLLLGHFQENKGDVQIVRSEKVINELLDTVLTVRDYVVAGVMALSFAALVIALLVFFLSLRLRQGERFTLDRIGASHQQIIFLMAAEVLVVLLVSVVLSVLLAVLTQKFGVQLLQQLLLG